MIQHVIKDDNLKSMGHKDGVKIVETYILNWKNCDTTECPRG